MLQPDHLEEASYYLEYLNKNKPGDQMTNILLQKTGEVMSYKKQLVTDPENSKALFGLADYYLFIKNSSEAKKYIDKAQKIYPTDKITHELLNKYNKLVAGEKSSI